MSGLLTEHLELIRYNIKSIKTDRHIILATVLILFVPFISILHVIGSFQPVSSLTDSQRNLTFGLLAICLSIFALAVTFAETCSISQKEFRHCLTENYIKQTEEKLKHIGECIKLFYLPLSVLLTIPDQPENAQERAKKIAEINCNKHLAEPRVRARFESYMEGKKDPKLSELVKIDIEYLQKQYAEEKQKLTGE